MEGKDIHPAFLIYFRPTEVRWSKNTGVRGAGHVTQQHFLYHEPLKIPFPTKYILAYKIAEVNTFLCKKTVCRRGIFFPAAPFPQAKNRSFLLIFYCG